MKPQELTQAIQEHLQQQLGPDYHFNHLDLGPNHITIMPTNYNSKMIRISITKNLQIRTRTYTAYRSANPNHNRTYIADNTYLLADPKLLQKLAQAVQELTQPPETK